jgi:putative phage-type endonuclease
MRWPFPLPALSNEERRSVIGASDAPIIMGKSPWCTPYELWQLKMGITQPRPTSTAMLRGIVLEEEARQAFSAERGTCFKPRLIRHSERPWMVASLDGISASGAEIVEIKCPGEHDHAKAEAGTVPSKYHHQLYHQMEVAGLPTAWYYSWNGKEGCAVLFRGDGEEIAQMMAKELEFWECMVQKKAPTLTAGDIKKRETLQKSNRHC